MLSFQQFIIEGNEVQQRIHKQLVRGHSVGTISPEGPHTDTPAKKKASHVQMRSDLEQARKEGHISGWSGPHKGQYQYGSGAHEVAKEGAYVVHHYHHGDMVKKLKELGNKHNQETIMHVAPSGEAHYSHLNRSEKRGEEQHMGRMHYNKPLKQGGGNTQLKHGKTSFTVQEGGERCTRTSST